MTGKYEITTNVTDCYCQDMQFIYILFGWEGSAYNSQVRRDVVTNPNGL